MIVVILSEAREWWNVAVLAVDEDDIHSIRLSLDREVRPRLKDRFVVPAGASLFDVESTSHITAEADLRSRAFCSEVSWHELRIANTFLHTPKKAVPTRAKSTPPNM